MAAVSTTGTLTFMLPSDKVDIVWLLICRDGVDINARDNNGNTALSIAAT